MTDTQCVFHKEEGMGTGDDVKNLEMRISKLESMLSESVNRRQVSDISADELRAYQKVRDVVAADWGEFCGINDCFRCIVVRCIRYDPVPIPIPRPCDVECSCGPCNIGRFGGGMGRFSGLGG
jgi:hypothetical protein